MDTGAQPITDAAALTQIRRQARITPKVFERLVRSHSITSSSNSRTRVGVWTCTPGRWRRQVVQAEFCHFLEGECTFTPDGGEPVEVRSGDVLYFPPHSAGVWDIRSASHKIFIVFDEGAMQ